MSYASATVGAVDRAPPGLHKQLARAAIKLDLPIVLVAQAVGATRWTVYRWFKGYAVSPAYRQRVSDVVTILENSRNREHAWKLLQAHYNL